MHLVRGRHLPEVRGIFESLELNVSTHPCGGDESMWIATLTRDREMRPGDFDASLEQSPGTPVVTETVARWNTVHGGPKWSRWSEWSSGLAETLT
jgi:hypothetical protein